MTLSRNFFKWVAIVAIVGLSVNSLATWHLYKQQGEETAHRRSAAVAASIARDEAIRQGQIQNCHLIGEPVRIAEIKDSQQNIVDAKQQIKSSRTVDYTKLFPKFDPDQLRRLIDRQRDRDHATLTTNQNILKKLQAAPPCEDRYPPIQH